jgi:hypothetical protein
MPDALFCDQSTDRHPREGIKQRQHSLPNCAADIFEINVDSFWARGCQPLREFWITMIDGGVEAQLINDVTALFRSASHADCTRST